MGAGTRAAGFLLPGRVGGCRWSGGIRGEWSASGGMIGRTVGGDRSDSPPGLGGGLGCRHHESMVCHRRLDGLDGLWNFTEFFIILRGMKYACMYITHSHFFTNYPDHPDHAAVSRLRTQTSTQTMPGLAQTGLRGLVCIIRIPRIQ